MSYLIAVPDTLTATATNVAGIGSSLSEANSAAAAPTTGIVVAAEDEVSAAVASLFSGYGKEFQALSAQAAEFHSQFVQALNAGAEAYASTEAANAGPLQALAALSLTVPNVAISVSGVTLLQLGGATASSVGDHLLPLTLAIALGPNSNAASGGLFSPAFALGAGSSATTTGNIASAFALGAGSSATTTGNAASAFALGAGSTATTTGNLFSSAIALGAGSDATTTGNPGGWVELPFPLFGQPLLLPVAPNFGNIAAALGPSSSASASGGNIDTAVALGLSSSASAFDGNHNTAVALGDALSASASGGGMTDIVTFLGTL